MKQLVLICVLSAISFNTSAQKYHYYFGNIHSHSDYSDGNQEKLSGYDTPAESYQAAMEADHFDFLGISEHNHSKARGGYKDTVKITVNRFQQGLLDANNATTDGEFVALYGLEWGLYKTGHVLVYGGDKLINWEPDNNEILVKKNDYINLFKTINKCQGCFAYLAHPKKSHFNEIFTKDYRQNTNKNFRVESDKAIIGMAIRNGPSHSATYDYSNTPSSTYHVRYKDLLADGYHVGVGIDHDNHYTNFGRSSKSRLVVMAEDLSQESVLEALRNRRFYASDDWNVEVTFELNFNTMGSILKSSSKPKIFLEVNDDHNDTTEKINLYYGVAGDGERAKILKTFENVDDFSFEPEIEKNKEYYFYVEIIQKESKTGTPKDYIWTSPIWYTWTE